MGFPQKIARIKISLNKIYIPEIIQTIIEFQYFHIIEKVLEQKEEKEPKINSILTIEQQNEINNKIKIVKNYLDDIIQQIGLTQNVVQNLNTSENNKIIINFKDLNEFFDQLVLTTENLYLIWKRIVKRINELDNVLRNIVEIMAFFNLINKFGGKHYNPSEFKRLNFEYYVCKKDQYNVLIESLNRFQHPILYHGEQIDPDSVGIFLFYNKDYEKYIQDLTITYNCRKINIPNKYIDKEGFNLQRLEKDYEYELELRKKLSIEYKNFIETIPYKILGLSEALSNGIKIYEIYKGFQRLFSKNLTCIEGYVPLNLVKKFIQHLKNLLGDKISIEIFIIDRACPYEEEIESKEKSDNILELEAGLYSITEKIHNKKIPTHYKRISVNKLNSYEKPPTLLKLSKFSTPYRSLVDLYGIANYSELDPTPFLVITFTMIFGLMFGDIGHGLVLLIASIFTVIFYKKPEQINTRRFGFVLFYCGIGSIIGGFLYGEYFGYPLIIFSHHVVLLGDPMEKITLLIKVSIIIGVLLIILGWIIRFVNYYMNNRKFLAFADPFIKILIISGGTYLIFNYMFDIKAWLSPPYPILFVIIPSILFLIIRIIGKLFRVASYMKRKSYGSIFSETFMDYFETMLQIISNVASFIRIVALEMAHVGLMLVVTKMVELINSSSILYVFLIKPLILILGNAFVIVLEIILVIIHGMRLHFYEFFSKFYVGNGIKYNKINLDSKYCQMNFSIEKGSSIIIP